MLGIIQYVMTNQNLAIAALYSAYSNKCYSYIKGEISLYSGVLRSSFRAQSTNSSYNLYICCPTSTSFPPCIHLQMTIIIFFILGSSRNLTKCCDAPHSQSSSLNVKVDHFGAKELLPVAV